MTDPRKPIFDAIKAARGKGFDVADVTVIDAMLDHLGVPKDGGLTVNARGLALMREFEGCRLDAYPDPGSKDGNPWTIGWGATGAGIHRGVRWTQEQADERHEADVAKFAQGVARLLGDTPTTSDQFSAMVALAYNIGLGAFEGSTVLRKHRAGDHAGAAQAFGMWVRNDGRVMNGLIRRRRAEADLYLGGGA